MARKRIVDGPEGADPTERRAQARELALLAVLAAAAIVLVWLVGYGLLQLYAASSDDGPPVDPRRHEVTSTSVPG